MAKDSSDDTPAKKILAVLTLVISVLAFAVSALTYYRAYWDEDHDLRLAFETPDHAAAEEFNLSKTFAVPVVLFNYGNRTEAVVTINPHLRGSLGKSPADWNGPNLGPFVIKPGEATAVPLSMPLTTPAGTSDILDSLLSNTAYLEVYVDFVDADGKIINPSFPIGKIAKVAGKPDTWKISFVTDTAPYSAIPFKARPVTFFAN